MTTEHSFTWEGSQNRGTSPFESSTPETCTPNQNAGASLICAIPFVIFCVEIFDSSTVTAIMSKHTQFYICRQFNCCPPKISILASSALNHSILYYCFHCYSPCDCGVSHSTIICRFYAANESITSTVLGRVTENILDDREGCSPILSCRI